MAEIDVIGLGNGGGNIAEEFLKFDNYKVHIVDSEERETEADFYKIPEEEHEGYDKMGDFEEIKNDADGEGVPVRKSGYEKIIPEFYDSIETDTVYFFLCGSGDISGATFSLLFPLRKKNISVIYVEPDTEFLTEKQQKKNRAVKSALQEYARSAKFKKMFLVKNVNLEEIIGNVPVSKYYSRLNKLLSFTIHTIDVCEHKEPIFGKLEDVKDVNRISTFGVMKDGQEKLFYPLKFVREYVYYYLVTEERLENDSELLPNVKQKVKEEPNEKQDVSFGIFQSDVQDYNYCTVHTSIPQWMNVENVPAHIPTSKHKE